MCGLLDYAVALLLLYVSVVIFYYFCWPNKLLVLLYVDPWTVYMILQQ